MERISERHEGDLGGRLEPFGQVPPMAVAVVVAPDAAHLAATQHTVWMLVNLLARAVGVVDTVRVVCPTQVPLAGRVVPLAPRDLTLDDAVVHGGQAVGAVPVEHATAPARTDIMLVVGPGRAHRHKGQLLHFVSGHGWWGGVNERPMPYPQRLSDLPFGPYVAAALAVGEIYLHARLPHHVARHSGTTYGWDCWAQILSVQPVPGAPNDLGNLDLSGTAWPVSAQLGACGCTRCGPPPA